MWSWQNLIFTNPIYLLYYNGKWLWTTMNGDIHGDLTGEALEVGKRQSCQALTLRRINFRQRVAAWGAEGCRWRLKKCTLYGKCVIVEASEDGLAVTFLMCIRSAGRDKQVDCLPVCRQKQQSFLGIRADTGQRLWGRDAPYMLTPLISALKIRKCQEQEYTLTCSNTDISGLFEPKETSAVVKLCFFVHSLGFRAGGGILQYRSSAHDLKEVVPMPNAILRFFTRHINQTTAFGRGSHT